MFYCDPCATKRAWPHPTMFRSMGLCEVCERQADCNDIPSKYLSVPKNVVPIRPEEPDAEVVNLTEYARARLLDSELEAVMRRHPSHRKDET